MLPNLVGRAADASLGWLWPSWRSKANRGQIQWITYVLPIWYLVSRWGLGPKVCMHHFGWGMNSIKGYYMVEKVKNETFRFSTYSMEMHSLTSSSFIICLWGETFGSRTILLGKKSKYFSWKFLKVSQNISPKFFCKKRQICFKTAMFLGSFLLPEKKMAVKFP